jgi:hypothetical protein
VLPLMFSEVGLKEPPPPAIDILAELIGLQAGVGLGDGLGEGLALGDGLGLGEALGLGEGLGLCASVAFAPTLRKITPMAMTAQCPQGDCFGRRVRGARLDWIV